MSAAFPVPILATKLYIPSVRSGWVPRPRLIARLDGGLDHKLTLVSAPAGFGKTSLLCAWAARLCQQAPGGRAVAWVSLDEGDSDPLRFVSYVVAALQTLPGAGDLGQAFLADLPSVRDASDGGLFVVGGVLTTLINEMVAFARSFVLVLDDYHLIEDSRIHQGMSFLLTHLPPNAHLVVSGRSAPPSALGPFESARPTRRIGR